MKENKYDDSVFFEQYSHMPRSEQGLSAAGEWPALKALLPELAGKRVLDVDRRDGVKLLLEGDAWVMMRPSGTEPLVRIYAEAATTDEVNELLDAAEAVVTSL